MRRLLRLMCALAVLMASVASFAGNLSVADVERFQKKDIAEIDTFRTAEEADMYADEAVEAAKYVVSSAGFSYSEKWWTNGYFAAKWTIATSITTVLLTREFNSAFGESKPLLIHYFSASVVEWDKDNRSKANFEEQYVKAMIATVEYYVRNQEQIDKNAKPTKELKTLVKMRNKGELESYLRGRLK